MKDESTERTETANAAGTSISEHDLAVAHVVQEVADELDWTRSEVAIAWTTARSDGCLIFGARRVEQLADNLRAVDITLAREAHQRLDAASDFKIGFPADFIRDTEKRVLRKGAS